MKLMFAALLAGAAWSGQAVDPSRHIDLDRPGALAQVQRDRPAHYRVIQRIIEEAPGRRPQNIARWVRTAFDARMASAMQLKASYPPRARLEFVLDDTAYRTTLTLRNVRPGMMPTSACDPQGLAPQ